MNDHANSTAPTSSTGDQEGGTLDAQHVTIQGGSTPTVNAQTVTVNQGGVQQVKAVTLAVHQGGIGRAEGESIQVDGGGIGVAQGKAITVSGGVGVLFAEHLEAKDATIGLAIASEISGDAKIALDMRSAAVLGLVLGLVLSFFRLIGRGRADKG